MVDFSVTTSMFVLGYLKCFMQVSTFGWSQSSSPRICRCQRSYLSLRSSFSIYRRRHSSTIVTSQSRKSISASTCFTADNSSNRSYDPLSLTWLLSSTSSVCSLNLLLLQTLGIAVYELKLRDLTPKLITSLSNGSLALLASNSSGSLDVESTWKAHDFEPWITSWDCWDLNSVWSGILPILANSLIQRLMAWIPLGGDDLKLKRWDIRDISSPTFVNRKWGIHGYRHWYWMLICEPSFEAGVTTISSSPHTPHLLAVGR